MPADKYASAQRINSWPTQERPREKLLLHGEHRLSDAELLAILLRTGCNGKSAVELAREIMQRFGGFRNMAQTDNSRWRTVKGLGTAKLCQIKAALEIGRRFREVEARAPMHQVAGASDIADLLMPRLRDLKKELFKVILLNAKNRILEIAEIAEGSVNQVNPLIREILHRCLQSYAAAFVCVHNHPSGDPQPSREDVRFTRQLREAAGYVQIQFLDHIIIGDDVYFSFSESGNW